MSRKNFYRVRTRAERRQRSQKEGSRDPVIGARESRRRDWIIRQLINKHGGRCTCCGESVVINDETHPRYATIDHVMPLSKGGLDVISNMTLLCLECNGKKGASTINDSTVGEEAHSS